MTLYSLISPSLSRTARRLRRDPVSAPVLLPLHLLQARHGALEGKHFLLPCEDACLINLLFLRKKQGEKVSGEMSKTEERVLPLPLCIYNNKSTPYASYCEKTYHHLYLYGSALNLCGSIHWDNSCNNLYTL